jgi:hypothetical protein
MLDLRVLGDGLDDLSRDRDMLLVFSDVSRHIEEVLVGVYLC